jgi:ring-1,2-phenylacetyl-CoA epoxidase subunit PaaC
MHEPTAYESLVTGADDARWAFGTGFEDPMSNVSRAVPDDVDPADLAAYCLMLGDDALLTSHRLQEWVARAPELEEETALANLALDLLGQARLLLTRAGDVDGSGRSEDDLAFTRAAHEFLNVTLAEVAGSDFADLIARLLAFSTWRLALFERLVESRDPMLSAIATKGRAELGYHRDYAAQWLIRLGDGTALSHDRAQRAVVDVEPLLDELFQPTEVELRLAAVGVAVDPGSLRAEFDAVLHEVFAAATLHRAPRITGAGCTGRDGQHTEALTDALADLQSVARANAGATW